MAASSSFYALLDTTGRVQSHGKHTWSEPENVFPQRPAWQADGLCRGQDVNVFFPAQGGEEFAIQAKKVCAECPVKAPCLAYALALNMSGVWGGTSGADRRKMKRGTRRLAS